MPKAYILINWESGYEKQVANSIKSINNIITCNIVYGLYDIVVEIMFDTTNPLQDIIQKKIRNVSRIQSTMTLIPYNS